MQDLVAAIAVVAGILVGFWLRHISARREKHQLEILLGESATSLAAAKTELAEAQSVAASRAGFESLAIERAKTSAQMTAERDGLRADFESRLESERQLSARVSALEA